MTEESVGPHFAFVCGTTWHYFAPAHTPEAAKFLSRAEIVRPCAQGVGKLEPDVGESGRREAYILCRLHRVALKHRGRMA